MADPAQSGRKVRSRASRKPSGASGQTKSRSWQRAFLVELAATSNVAASARAAGINASTAYEARRKNPQFYRDWQEALCEGYEHLEMTLLHRLREGEIKPAAGAKRGTRVFDNATALRLLLAHRDSAARQQAVRENRNADTVIAGINAKLDRIRETMLAEAIREAEQQSGSAGDG